MGEPRAVVRAEDAPTPASKPGVADASLPRMWRRRGRTAVEIPLLSGYYKHNSWSIVSGTTHPEY